MIEIYGTEHCPFCDMAKVLCTQKQKEFEESEREIRLELLRNKDQKDDAQRKMCYYALAGMLLYGPLIVLTSFLELDNGAKMLVDIASVYYISVSGLIAAYFGFSSAFPKK